jgi:hypothetical protein
MLQDPFTSGLLLLERILYLYEVLGTVVSDETSQSNSAVQFSC